MLSYIGQKLQSKKLHFPDSFAARIKNIKIWQLDAPPEFGVGGQSPFSCWDLCSQQETERGGSRASLRCQTQPDVETELCRTGGGISGLASHCGYGHVLLNSVTPVAAFWLLLLQSPSLILHQLLAWNSLLWKNWACQVWVKKQPGAPGAVDTLAGGSVKWCTHFGELIGNF